MSQTKPTVSKNLSNVSSNDPLGIKGIALGGAPPSLHVEAKIAASHWQSRISGKSKVSDRRLLERPLVNAKEAGKIEHYRRCLPSSGHFHSVNEVGV